MAMNVIIVARQRWEQLSHLAATLKSKLLPEKHEEEAPEGDTFFHGLLQAVLWLSFAAFLFASLPHVAYFFATFEPQNSDGSISDYWWMVAYILAVSIDVTAFLLSVNVAVKMRRATAGKVWIAKIVPASLVILTHWPFILILVGFSWLVNFEHAKEFHSTMLATAEQVEINLLLWHGKLADLNPIIASAFPVLAVAYTGMSDRIGDERKAAGSAQPVTVVQASTVKQEDIDAALKALAEVHSLREQLAQLQAVKVAEVQAPVNPVQQIPAQSETLAILDEALDEIVTMATEKPERGLVNPLVKQSYEPQITALYKANPAIEPAEVVQITGCSFPTATKWLSRLQPATKGE